MFQMLPFHGLCQPSPNRWVSLWFPALGGAASFTTNVAIPAWCGGVNGHLPQLRVRWVKPKWMAKNCLISVFHPILAVFIFGEFIWYILPENWCNSCWKMMGLEDEPLLFAMVPFIWGLTTHCAFFFESFHSICICLGVDLYTCNIYIYRYIDGHHGLTHVYQVYLIYIWSYPSLVYIEANKEYMNGWLRSLWISLNRTPWKKSPVLPTISIKRNSAAGKHWFFCLLKTFACDLIHKRLFFSCICTLPSLFQHGGMSTYYLSFSKDSSLTHPHLR